MWASEIPLLPRRTRSMRLEFDSEQEAAKEERRKQEDDQLQKRLLDKKQRRQVRSLQEQARQDQRRRFEEPQTMFEQDSNSHDSFARAHRKIAIVYPEAVQQRVATKRKRMQSSEQDCASENQEGLVDQRESRDEITHETRVARRARTEQIKLQEPSEKKQMLVRQLSVRWWYALPEWPPSAFPYERELRKKGYRLVEEARYKFQENEVSGLLKACAINGYKGLFKAKNKLIDLRPMQLCPSMANLRRKEVEQLSKLLKVALTQQLAELRRRINLTIEEEELITSLEGKLKGI